MATILDALKSINAYPVPLRTLIETAEGRGISLTETIENDGLVVGDEATEEVLHSKEFLLAKADILMWLSVAPNVSQGGQSYSFTDAQRSDFRNRAYALYKEYAPTSPSTPTPLYGYKGSRL